MSGSWQTWYLYPDEYQPLIKPRLYRSVDPNNPDAEHPAGNLSYEASGSIGGEVLVLGDDGRLCRTPAGSIVVWRMLNYQKQRGAR